jgi:hypothetical protein
VLGKPAGEIDPVDAGRLQTDDDGAANPSRLLGKPNGRPIAPPGTMVQATWLNLATSIPTTRVSGLIAERFCIRLLTVMAVSFRW